MLSIHTGRIAFVEFRLLELSISSWSTGIDDVPGVSEYTVASNMGDRASWSENCIFVNAEDIIDWLVLLSHCVTSIIISLTYSLVFHLEKDRF